MEEKQMKTLGGYEIVDEKAREEIHVVSEKADEALSLAKGATKAFVYDTYSDMIAELNALDKAELLVNFHVMIRTVCVPDLWISGVSDEHVEYTYTSNEDFIVDLTEDGIVQVGYFILSALETQKVDLSEYVKNTDYAGLGKVGVASINSVLGISVMNNANYENTLTIRSARETDIDAKTSFYYPITPSILDYAVMKALSDSKLEWTDEQKQLARALLGAIGSNNVHADNGLAILGNGQLIISPPIHSLINDRNKDDAYSQRRAVTLSVLDYAVKKALSDCKLTGDDVWTDEEKAKALELLGGVPKFTDKATGQAYYLYGVNANGTLVQVGVSYNNTAQQNRVPQYGANGILFVGTPTEDSHATTKKYVDDGFVGKPTTGDGVLYFDSGLNPTVVKITDGTVANAYQIPRYAQGGVLPVGTPSEDAHATNKKYVDDLVTSTKDSIALKDASTGQKYNIRINDGVLEMVLVDEEVE